MATGRSHSIATLTASTCLTVQGDYMMAAGCFAGMLLSPDLDVDAGNISDYFAAGFGKRAGILWRKYWWLYGKLMSHRSFLSHFPIVSTVIRLAYAFWWLYLLGFQLPPEFIVGLIVSDTLHWLMDAKPYHTIVVWSDKKFRVVPE